MLGYLKKKMGSLVGGKGEQSSVVPESKRLLPLRDVERDDIPRYPPFIRGFPAVDVKNLLEMQAQLIDEIRSSLGMTHEQFNELFLPLIENLASYVHLLPASESHHHRGAGGLFRHSLEVCLNASKISKAPIFAIDGTPQFRRDTEPLWRMACAVAGLLHDIGKPVTDMIVTNKDGSLIWNSFEHTLLADWLAANNIDRFFLTWNKNRHKEHESAAHLVFRDLIPKQTWAHLAQKDPRVFKALSDAVLIQSRIGNKVAETMSLADRSSVRIDMQTQNIDMDQFALGIPVERYVFDGIRRLVNSGKWEVNKPGGRVWHLKQGTFIAWRSLSDLYLLLDQDNIPGIPRDPATLADLLIDGGFCQPQTMNVSGEERTRRYWEVQPEGVPAKIEMLMFNSHSYVFTSEPPATIDAQIEGMESEPQVVELVNTETGEVIFGSSDMASGNLVVAVGEVVEQNPALEAAVTSIDELEDVVEPEAAAEPEPDVEPFVQPIQRTATASTNANDVLANVGVASALSMFDPIPVEPEPDPVAADEQKTDLVREEPEPEVKPEPANCSPVDKDLPNCSPVNKALPSKTVPNGLPEKPAKPAGTGAGEAFNELLAKYTGSGQYLGQLAKDSQAHKFLVVSAGKVGLAFPSAVRCLGEQDEVMELLRADKAIELDPVMPGTGVQMFGGHRCVVLVAELGTALLPLLPADIGSGLAEDKKPAKPAARKKPAKPKAAEPSPKPEPVARKPKTPAKSAAHEVVQSEPKAAPDKPVKEATAPHKPAQNTAPAAEQSVKRNSKAKPSPEKPKTPDKTQSRQNFMPGKAISGVAKPAAPIEGEPDPKPKAEPPLSLPAEPEKPAVDESKQDAGEFQRPMPTGLEVARSLRAMIENGKGSWLVGDVTTIDRVAEVSARTIKKIVEHHPHLSSGQIRQGLRSAGFVLSRQSICLDLQGKQTQSGDL